jgi:hypothetical protein
MTSNAVIDHPAELRDQVERIANSETFRASEALQRLLKYLADKVASGDLAQLKEYTIGVEGLGRPTSYDPGHDSAVRVQVGRLRQKLAEYYSTEGRYDPLHLTLPKGGFRLSYDTTFQVTSTPQVPKLPVAPGVVRKEPFRFRILHAVVAMLAVWALAATSLLLIRHPSSPSTVEMTPALRELWKPFLTRERRLFIGIRDPVFIEFNGNASYRVPTQADWRDIQNSPPVMAIRKALGTPDVRITRRYANIAEAYCTFLLGKFFASWASNVSLIRTSEVSWHQLAGSNLLFVGGPPDFDERLKSMPTELDLGYEAAGIRIRNPKPGEPSFVPDISPGGSFEEGENLALVTHVPGPDGQGDIETFTSRSAPAEVGALQWFADADRAAYLVSKLRNQTGHVARYYQIIFKVRFKGGIPTDTSYILHHDLPAPRPPLK